MGIYAVIENKLVSNCIMAESMEIAISVCPNKTVVELTEDLPAGIGIGWGYENGTFINPRPVVPPAEIE